jgi:peptide deformylase
MDCMKAPDAPRPMVLINPEILWSSDDPAPMRKAACRSPTNTPMSPALPRCACAGPALDGSVQEEQFTGLWATCVQHEIDHLDGKLFIDYLGPIKRQMITRKMEKLKRDRARSA